MIYVFKTSVKMKVQAMNFEQHLDKLLLKAKWNFALRDCDRALHIESEKHQFDHFKIQLWR